MKQYVQGKCEDVTVSWGSYLASLLPSDQSAIFLSTLLMVREALCDSSFLPSGLIGPCNCHDVQEKKVYTSTETLIDKKIQMPRPRCVWIKY